MLSPGKHARKRKHSLEDVMQLEVVDWLDDEEAEEHDDCMLSGLGGWVNGEQRGGYLAQFHEKHKLEAARYFDAFARAVVSRNLCEGGNWHQSCGVPLFSDGKVLSLSYRGWGDIMAAVWNEELGTRYSYMKFYMSNWGNKLPADKSRFAIREEHRICEFARKIKEQRDQWSFNARAGGFAPDRYRERHHKMPEIPWGKL